MKKYILGSLIICFLTLCSCSKDDSLSNKSCETLAQESQVALSLYSTQASTENCQSYKDILKAQLDKGCFEEQEEDFIRRAMNSLNCF